MAETEHSISETGKDSHESKKVCSNDIISLVIGDFGKWQLGISILMGLLKFPLAWFQLEIVFLAPVPQFSCKKPLSFTNYSDHDWERISRPVNQTSSCFIYDPKIVLSRIESNDTNISIIPCEEFSYNQTVFSSTIITEWDLVCTRVNFAAFYQMSLMFGVIVGSVLFGFLADHSGRKKSLMFAIGLQAFAGFVSSLVPWFSGLVIASFVLGLASGGIATVSFVMCMEIVSGRWRTTIPILYQLPFGFGNFIMAGLSFWLRDWRHFQCSLSIFSSLYLVYYWLVPESPRWLIATGQKEKAIGLLEKVAIINSSDPTVAEALISNESSHVEKKVKFMILFKSKNMRMKTIILSVQWFGTGICLFAFSQYMGRIGSNIFITVATGGLVGIPGVVFCILIVQHFGRKSTIIVFELLTAICFLSIIAFPKGEYPADWPRLMFAGLGIMGMSIYLPVLYLYTGELYPTVVRNTGVGAAAMFSRVGAMLAPFIVSLDEFSASLPLIVLSLITALQTIFLYPLPETKGCPLLDSICEAEHFDKKAAFKIKNNNNVTNET